MKRAIRNHWRDFAAIIALLVIALGVASYILSQQRFNLPGWVPLIGSDRVELEVELSSAQAVIPGQGQTVNVAGVKVGEVKTKELDGTEQAATRVVGGQRHPAEVAAGDPLEPVEARQTVVHVRVVGEEQILEGGGFGRAMSQGPWPRSSTL